MVASGVRTGSRTAVAPASTIDHQVEPEGVDSVHADPGELRPRRTEQPRGQQNEVVGVLAVEVAPDPQAVRDHRVGPGGIVGVEVDRRQGRAGLGERDRIHPQPVARTKVGVYVVSGFCSGLAGILFSFYTLSGRAGRHVPRPRALLRHQQPLDLDHRPVLNQIVQDLSATTQKDPAR